MGAQVLFLQETHLTHTSVPKLPTNLFPQGFLSNSPVAKSCGTAIALHKNFPFQPSEHCENPQGIYVFLKGTVKSQKYTFSTFCAPNSHQLTFIDSVLEHLEDRLLGRQTDLGRRLDFSRHLPILLHTLNCIPKTIL